LKSLIFICFHSNIQTGSFNFNYDTTTQSAATPSIDIITGVTCEECYIYAGAGLLLIFQYSVGLSNWMRFQAKIGGGAGFNADILIQDPSFSSSKVISLMGASAESSLTIGSFDLAYNFESLKATISGTVQGSGTAAFGGMTFFYQSFY
jgi:hypothetical protein